MEPTTGEMSKKQRDRQLKKYKKKVAQAQQVLLKAESKQFDELISLTPTEDLLITHFGNGDETD